MFVHENQRLILDLPFTINGENYPSNFLRTATPEQLAAAGIVEVIEQLRPDDRFYWITENLDGTFTTVDKDLAPTKAYFLSQIDQTAYAILAPTDYMDFRHLADATYTAPADWVAYRAAVRAYIVTIKTAINAAADIPALISAVSAIEWPPSPNATA